jgi:hypothetical protein
MKTCFKCGVEKPRTEFYAHKMMGDGLLGKCKDCTRYDVRLHRAENVERFRAYDRARSTPDTITPARKNSRRHSAWHKADPRRMRAHNMATRKITERKTLCEGCGKAAERLEKHHHDYDKPLSVIWLCKPCHSLADKLRRLTEASV